MLLSFVTDGISAIINWGFGHHRVHLSKEQVHMSLLYFFIFQCTVKNVVGITKMSFLFLYLDVFPQRKFRILCWALMIQIVVGLVALTFTTIFQCDPVAFSYDKTIHGGKWSLETSTLVFGSIADDFKHQYQSFLVRSVGLEHSYGCCGSGLAHPSRSKATDESPNQARASCSLCPWNLVSIGTTYIFSHSNIF